MRLYRIYTEDKNRERIEEEVSKYFDGFTIYEAIGYWKREKEKSLVIEILRSGWDYKQGTAETLAENIRILNKQEVVLLTEQKVTGLFI